MIKADSEAPHPGMIGLMRPPHIATSLTASKTPEDLNGNEGVILGELQVHDVNEKPPPAANMDHLDKDAAAQLPRDDVLRVGGRQRVVLHIM